MNSTPKASRYTKIKLCVVSSHTSTTSNNVSNIVKLSKPILRLQFFLVMFMSECFKLYNDLSYLY